MNEQLQKEFDSCYQAIKKVLDDREEYVLLCRNGFPNGNIKTLEEIGEELGLTRERVRQIESDASKASSKLSRLTIYFQLLRLQDHLASKIYKVKDKDEAIEKGNYYISFEQCLKLVPSFNFYRLIALATGFRTSITVNFKYKVIPLKKEFADEIIILDSLLKNVGIAISKEKYEQSDESIRLAINEAYHLSPKGFYIRNKTNKRDVIGYIIDNYFANGYHISNTDDFEKFKECFENEFGFEYEITQREISVALDNGNYCLINKGTYLNPNKCPVIPEELLSEIVIFIRESSGTLFYETIYETFKDRLNELGINNWFFLKGVLDNQCKGLYKARKANLSVDDSSTYKDPIAEYLDQHNGEVTIEEFREEFPGLKDYMFYFRKYVKAKK